jgi:hypothetical protein
MLVSAVVAVGVVAVVVRWRLPRPGQVPGWVAGWLGRESAAHTLVVRPTWWLAHALARFDDRVLERAGDLAATGSMRVAARAARADDRWLDGLVERFAGAMRRLGEVARSPQTGQLHQYYLQAVVVLAIGVVLLVLVR